MINLDPQAKQWLDILTAASTAAAALFAAFSAWTSKASARAAKEAVEEARMTRRVELAPKLILEKEFLDFEFHWPHANSLNGEAVFLARKHWKDNDPAPPTFSLQNFGQSPALELTIVWELIGLPEELQVPDHLKYLGLSVPTSISLDECGAPIQSLMYATRDGGCGLPLYRRWTTDVASSSPNQKRTIEFPVYILNTLFLRGLQLGATMSNEELILRAKINCYAIDQSVHISQFRWKIMPFHHGATNPVVVYGHFIELPIYPKPEGPRVA